MPKYEKYEKDEKYEEIERVRKSGFVRERQNYLKFVIEAGNPKVALNIHHVASQKN